MRRCLSGEVCCHSNGAVLHEEQFAAEFDIIKHAIYVDASEHDLEAWYVARLLLLRETSLNDPRSYFNFLTRSSEEDTRQFGSSVWREINLANLRENIAPTRERAHLVLEKGSDHRVDRVRLRRF